MADEMEPKHGQKNQIQIDQGKTDNCTPEINSIIVECLISYILNKEDNHPANLPASKERKRLNISLKNDLNRVLSDIISHCGIREEAVKRGLGESIDVRIARLEKTKEGTKAFGISTNSAWQLEASCIKPGDTLQVTVLRKEVIFLKNSPVIQVVTLNSSSNTEPQALQKPKKGRKRIAKTLENKSLLEGLKKQKTGDSNLKRNERQQKDFDDMKEFASKLNGSEAIDEETIKCGKCHGAYKVSNALYRTPESKVQYFKSKHFDKACAKTERQDVGQSTDKMKSFMTRWIQSPKTSNDQSVDSDVDNMDDDSNLIDLETDAMDELSCQDTYDFIAERQTMAESQINMEQYDIHQNLSESNTESETNTESDSEIDDIDPEFKILPISIEVADEVCIKLNNLIKRGIISKDKIFYKYMNDICSLYYDSRHQYDSEVIEFFNTIKYLGGERTVNFLRGPMWYGSGRGGERNASDVKMNLGGPSKIVRQKLASGYTTTSGVNKRWLQTFIMLETDESNCVSPLVDSDTVCVYPVAMQNDSTALKAAIEFDEQQHINVGLVTKCDITYVKNNPQPGADVLRESVVTEANVTYLTTLDNTVSFPVAVTYMAKSGKNGPKIKQQFLSEIEIYQMCEACLEKAVSDEHILSNSEAVKCKSHCLSCTEMDSVCDKCKEKNHSSIIPALRACDSCLDLGKKCIKNVVLAVSTDCEAGNKHALESVINGRESGTLDPKYVFSCLPDAVHVGKSLKAGFANWFLLLGSERGCLSIVNTLRETVKPLKRILSRNAVMNKDRMDVDCILHLTKEPVINVLDNMGWVVHGFVPDQFKISPTNKVGLYPHPIAVVCGSFGKVLALDYSPMKKKSRLLEIRLHVPSEVQILNGYNDARSLTFVGGRAYVCVNSEGIYIHPPRVQPVVKNMKRNELEAELLSMGLSTDGNVAKLKENINKQFQKQEKHCKVKGVDSSRLQMSSDISPTCISSASDTILILASDSKMAFYQCELKREGILMCGQVHQLCSYLPMCKTVLCMSVVDKHIYASFSGEPGGIVHISLETHRTELLISNATSLCKEVHGVAAISSNEFVFTDIQDHQIKRYSEGNISIFAGCGEEGNNSGPAAMSAFGQPMGICVELKNNFYITDAQVGCIKLITTIKNTVKFLRNLRLLYMAFSVHLKHNRVPNLHINDGLKYLNDLCSYLNSTVVNVKNISGITRCTNGPEGTVASKTISSVQMITSELQNLKSCLSQYCPDYPINMQSCLTVQVENLHATGHFKEQFPTCLQYARNLANTVHESVKRSVDWSAYYYTHASSYYPLPQNRMRLCQVPRMLPLSPKRELNSAEQTFMQQWAADFGKCVRQKTVRQETTKFKAGTLPLNMYISNTIPEKKISFEYSNDIPDPVPVSVIEEEGTIPETTNSHTDIEVDQVSEYDTDSEEEPDITDMDSDEDKQDSNQELLQCSTALNFMRAVTTRSGRMVKISNKFF